MNPQAEPDELPIDLLAADLEHVRMLRTALQLVALGILIGNKDSRRKVQPRDFETDEFQAACESIQQQGKHGYACLQEIMQMCGVEWDGTRKLIDAVLEQLKLDARVTRARQRMLHLSKNTLATPDHKRRFLADFDKIQKDV